MSDALPTVQFNPWQELPDELERYAAAIWQRENPSKTVWQCSAEDKALYRTRVLNGERP